MQAKSDDIITVNTVGEYADLFGCPQARHPLFCTCRLSDVRDYVPVGKPVRLNLYSVAIKDGTTCNARYGWRSYDFSCGAINFFAPGQMHCWDEHTANSGRWGWLLAFHPDFVRKYPLGEKILRLRYFSYEVDEALHISDSERKTVEGIMDGIEGEYLQGVDRHTQDSIVAQLDVLFCYAERFYDRQFRMRSNAEPDILVRVQRMFRQHLDERRGEFLSVSAVASELNMSPHYLSDLLRSQTGMNTKQHIHAYLVDCAKVLLANTQLSVSEVAYRLGFEYPQHFNRLFKRKTGITPSEYRKLTWKHTAMTNIETNGRISRRTFLKQLGLAGVLAGAPSCVRKGDGDRPGHGPMTCRTDPKTGRAVSVLGYGCMRWPPAAEPSADGCPIDQDTVNRLVDYAMGHGVNYFDTAPIYCQGWSERVTGIALKRHPRDSYLVATKMSASDDLSPENMTAMYRRSLADLQVDYIDYYLLHAIGGGGMDMFERRFVANGMLDFLLAEREHGRIRHLGWSFHGDIDVFKRVLDMHDTIHWDFVQIQLNYVDWRHAAAYNSDWQAALGDNANAEYLYGELARRNISVFVMEPLLGGRLANVDQNVLADMKQKRPGHTAASWAMCFAGSLPGVLTVLSGMTYMEHLKDNLSTCSPLEPLSVEEQGFLEDVAVRMAGNRYIPCTDCKYCMPCPYGIDIPAIFLHYNKCVNNGMLPESSRHDGYGPARRAFLIGYDRSVPRLRQAAHCIGCGRCASKCPQGIDIPSQMQSVDRFVERLRRDEP